MDNALTNIANNRPLLIAMIVVGAILIVWALIRGRTRIRGAIGPGLPGLIILGFAIAAIVRNPFSFGSDSDHPELLASLKFANQQPEGDDWPQWRGVNRDGIGKAPGLRLDWEKKPPEILWTTPCHGGFSSFAVVGDRVWTQDYHGGNERVICLDAKTGKERWSYEYPVDYSGFKAGYAFGPRATPTVDAGRVYTVGATGKMLCLEADPADGKPHLIWEHDLLTEFKAEMPTWGVACSPLIHQNLVVVQPGGSEGSIAAFDRETGNKVWSSLSDPSGYSSPVVGRFKGSSAIVAMTGLRLVVLDPATGNLHWSFDWQTQFNGNIATPIVTDNSIFISSGYNAGCALFAVNEQAKGIEFEPAFVRRNKLMRNHHMTCVLRDGFIYGFDDRRLKCVNLHTAAEAWETANLSKGTLILADDHLIVLTEDGTLALVEAKPDAFHLKGKMPNVLTGPNTWALPALSRGRLYLRDSEKIVCLKVADEPAK